jgi:hypothetical protein
MKANFFIRVFTVTPFLLAAPAGHAEVTSVNQTGFALSHEGSVQAEPDGIYAAMTRIGEWWDPGHSWSGDSKNFYMDMRIGGCFCEKLPGGGGVEHLRLVYFSPGKEIRLAGGLGPLQGMGMGGTLVWTITPGEEGNTVSWTYSVHGHGTEDSMQGLAPIVDHVQQQAFERLLRYIETGQAGADPDS